MKACVAIAVLALGTIAHAQTALTPIRDAYQASTIAERITLEAPRPGTTPARSELAVAIRPGDDPAVALRFGAHRPLHVLAQPGRLLAWRADDPTRVYAAVLPEPFGLDAIESVLPPVSAPQIALALGSSNRLITMAGELVWSPVQGERRVVGVPENGATGVSLMLRHHPTGRLQGFEFRHGGTTALRAGVEALPPDAAWFEAPEMDGPNPPTMVERLADLALPPVPIEPGEPFGQAIGIDARGRPTTLRATAEPWEGPLVVLGIDARQVQDRSRWAGALAEADLPTLAESLGVRLVVLVVGADDSASLVERVTWPARGRGEPVRVLAVDGPPAWLGPWASAAAWRVQGRSWTLQSTHALPEAESASEPMYPYETPHDTSHAPLTLAERVRMLVGRAGRG